MLCMMFKMGLCAEKNWHRMRGLGHLAKVIERVQFKNVEPISELDQMAAWILSATLTLTITQS